MPVVLHEMRPLRATAAHKTDGYAELVCSNSFRSDDTDHNAVGLLHAEMRRLGSLVMRAADAHKVPAGGALAVDRDGFSAAVSAALAAHPLITLARDEVAVPPDDWDSVIIATGPLTSPDLAATIRALTGEDALAFFDAIAPIVHRDIDRSRSGLVPVALRQGRARRLGRRLHQLPADARAIRRLRRRAARRRQDRVPRLGSVDALFRRLPADRGDGRARPRDAAARADEAVRPDQSAPADSKALCGRAAAPGQQARHAVQHGRLPDQAEARRAGAHLPQHPRPAATPNSRASAACTATPSSIRPSCSTRRCGSRPMPRLRFAGQITGCEGYVESAAIGLIAARFAAAERRGETPRRRRRPRRTARCSRTSPAAISRPSMPALVVPADERQFRPVPADRHAAATARTPSDARSPTCKKRALCAARSPISKRGSARRCRTPPSDRATSAA